jgi:hypothetical protein
VIVYLDDILIYSVNREEHDALVFKVLKVLQVESLTADITKCIFDAESVSFLGFVLFLKDVSLANNIVQAILDWESLKSAKDVQVFLGFANFYRRFIRNFSGIAKPISETLKGNLKEFVWSQACQIAFDFLKACFIFASVLKHFKLSLLIFLETDAFDFAFDGALSQFHEGRMYLVAFLSRKLSDIERNYEIYDKKMLVIVSCFKQ